MAKHSHAAAIDWVGEMEHLFATAEFGMSGRVYDEAIGKGARPPTDAHLLRARIFLKEDANKAAAFLVSQKLERPTERQRALWSLYLATAYGRLHDLQRADHHFGQAAQKFVETSDRALLAYHRARRFLLEGRFDEARQSAEQMACDNSKDTLVDQGLLQSFIQSHEEQYLDESRTLIDVFRTIGSERDIYAEQWFHATQNLAILSRELPFPQAATVARREIDREINWPRDFSSQRFQALKAIGWALALQGDTLACFRYLRLAENVTPSDAFRCILLLDRMHFAKIVGESNWARNELAEAETTAGRVNWDATTGEERIALLLLAEAFADKDREKARYYLAQYAALGRIKSALHLFAFDHRIEAYAAYADGVVRLAAQDPGAEEALRKSWKIFDRIGYDWRAGRAALRLYALTSKDRWLHLAEDKLEHYGQSWLGAELRRARAGVAENVQLPPMQRKVFELLCGQNSTAEIAQLLDLSPHTVRNHLKAVFKAYGVNNRSALIAEAAKRGDLKSSPTVD